MIIYKTKFLKNSRTFDRNQSIWLIKTFLINCYFYSLINNMRFLCLLPSSNFLKNQQDNNILCFDHEQFKYQSGIVQMLHM